jgi:four helix bundle protein
MNQVNSFDELEACLAAFNMATKVSGPGKRRPKVEDHSSADQIRRSSRSIGANIAGLWPQRRHPPMVHPN